MNKPLQKTVSLKYPITLDGLTTGTLIMRRPQCLDVISSMALPGDVFAQNASLFANLCMVTPEMMDETDVADMDQLEVAFEELSDFEPIENYNPGDPIELGIPLPGVAPTAPAITSIAMRRPKTKDIRTAHASETSPEKKDCALYAALTGLPLSQIYALDWSDMRRLKTVYQGFLA